LTRSEPPIALAPSTPIELRESFIVVSTLLTSLNLEYNLIGDGTAALREIANGRPLLTLEL
jgi:hypothetical protein